MKFVKKILSLVLLFSSGSMNTRIINAPQTRQLQPAAAQPIPQPAQKAPQQKPQSASYASALNSIRTHMPSNKVLINNKFTQEFINFVTSLNLSTVQKQALLQAGIHLHASLSDNNKTNQQLLSSLNNNIQAITSAPRSPQVKPASPIIKPAPPAPVKQPVIPPKAITPAQPIPQPGAKKPIPAPQPATPKQPQQKSPQKPIAPVKPAPPGKPVAAQVPVKKVVPLPQVLPLADHFATNNLITLLDPKISETLATRVGAVAADAIHALNGKSAPIIMTSNIFEIILQIKQRIGDSQLQQLRMMNQQQRNAQAQRLAQVMPTVSYDLLSSLSTIDFNNLNYYFHKSTPLVLIVPKEYIRSNLAKAMNFNLSDQAKVCGFNPTVLNSITNLNTDNLLRELHAQQSAAFNEEQFIPHLTSMFISQKRNGELINPQQDTPWIVYISGHGHPAYLTVGPIRKQWKMFKSALSNPNMTITDHTGKPIARSTIALRVKEYEKQLEGKSSWPDSQLIPESAQIAGITGAQFAQLMIFFDQSLNTSYIHYISCFAGGSNQSFVNETLSSLNVNYIVSAAGVHEATTAGSTTKNFSDFFKLLRMFFIDPENFVKIKEKKQDPIIKILETISLENKEYKQKGMQEQAQQSQPFVRFPATDFFEAVALNKKTKVLTRTIVKAHEIERRPIDFSKTPIDILVINTPRINTLLNLATTTKRDNTAIVIPSPQSITPEYESLMIFKEIKSNTSLPLFLFNLIHLNAKAYPQTFAINTLTGIETQLPGTKGLPIKNLIIHTEGIAGTNNMGSEQPVLQYMALSSKDVRTSRIGVNAYVAFELNNNIYQTTFAIKNFDAVDILRTSMQSIKFTSTPKSSTKMNALATNFLTPQEITQVSKPLTLKSIVEFIDDKIDTQDPDMAVWADADEKALLQMVKSKARKQK